VSWKQQRDLRVVFNSEGLADLSVESADIQTITSADNLAQALTLRLIVHRGELTDLGHPRYGSRIPDLIGEPMDRENLGLLRRYVRKTLLSDPRVAEVLRLDLHLQPTGVVEVEAVVKPVSADPLTLKVAFDGG
jgi:phage baseplate assembly protein W